jgi:hypothetical protein
MMNICLGPSRKRITLQCTRFYTQGELFKLTRDQSRNSTVWLEYGPNLYQPIKNDYELRFACQMMEGEIDSYMPQEDREQNSRDVADAIHTHSYEMSIRVRRPRLHTTEGAKHRSKMSSSYERGSNNVNLSTNKHKARHIPLSDTITFENE